MSLEQTVTDYLNANSDLYVEQATKIWERPEIGLQEKFASKLLSDHLEEQGFTIERGVGQMPTAFVASWGEGRPIIGVLGEYDALPGLSQKVSPTRDPIEEGGPGHGCGHNLYGVAAVAATLAMREAMQEHGINGTVRFYGCPAEETLVGKTYMARAGVFDDLDAAVTWHPGYANTVWANGQSLAMNSFRVNFHGVASHGAAAPHLGRSALDGAMLMDIGVNYLREHVEQDARIHSVITNGGQAPNVVPPEAQIWYYVRAPKRDQVEEIYERMLDIAKGAALMSGTTYDIEFLTGCYELLPNAAISNVMLEKMEALGGIEWDHEDMAFARELQSSIPEDMIERDVEQVLKRAASHHTREDIGDVLCEKIIQPNENFMIMHGSTEVGDVSQITPTANLLTCCHPLGTPPHSWQTVAASGSSVGFKGMDFAARTMALTGLELLTDPEVLKEARKEFEEATGGKKYVTPLPEDAVPR